MSDRIVNLTELTETRSKMTPGKYRYTGPLLGVIDSGSGGPLYKRICEMHTQNEQSNAYGVVDTHNAADVLIEVAKAALDHRDAHAALDAAERDELYVGVVSFSQLTGRDQHRELKETINKTGEALFAALAKVTR